MQFQWSDVYSKQTGELESSSLGFLRRGGMTDSLRTVAYLGFQKGGRRDAEVVGYGGGVWRCAPSPEKNSFLRPQNNNFGAF